MFRTAKGREVEMDEIVSRVAKYIAQDPDAAYEFTIGTDSQNHGETKMVEVIAVHRKGQGGIYFYNIEFIRRISNLKQKINEETARSLQIANGLIEKLDEELFEMDLDLNDLDVAFQIHCDIGRYGKTSMLIKEIVSWVTSCGYTCLIKPDSYTASSIADRYSK